MGGTETPSKSPTAACGTNAGRSARFAGGGGGICLVGVGFGFGNGYGFHCVGGRVGVGGGSGLPRILGRPTARPLRIHHELVVVGEINQRQFEW